MRLEIGSDPVRFRAACVADMLQRRADRDAFGVLLRKRMLERVHAGEHARTHHSGNEARPFLVGPGGDFERRAGGDPRLVQRAHDFEPRHDPIGAVELPAGGLRIEMAAHHHGRSARIRSRTARENVADRIHTDRQSRLARPGNELVTPLAVRFGERHAPDASLRRRADRGEIHERAPETLLVHAESLHGMTKLTPLDPIDEREFESAQQSFPGQCGGVSHRGARRPETRRCCTPPASSPTRRRFSAAARPGRGFRASRRRRASGKRGLASSPGRRPAAFRW